MAKLKNLKRQKRQKKNFNLSENEVINLSLFFIIAFYFYLRVFMISRIGLNGISYLASALDFLILFILLIPFALNNILSRLIRNKLRVGQFANTKRLIYSGFILVSVYSIIISLIILFAKEAVIKELLINKSSTFCLLFLLPTIFISSISAICKSFIRATGAITNLLILEIIEKIFMIISTMVCTNLFVNYGDKVSHVLVSPEYKYVFGAAGAALGISIGMLIGLLFYFFMYANGARSLNRNDNVKKVDDIYDIFNILKTDLLKFVAPFFFIILYLVIGQTFFFRQMEILGKADLTTYQWGTVGGCLLTILIIPCIWFMSKTYMIRELLYSAVRNDDRAEVRIAISELLENLLSYLIPFAVFVFITASYFTKGFLLIDSDLAVRIIRIGAVLCITIPLIIACINVLQAIGKPMMVILNGIITLILGVASLILFVSILKMGIYGVVFSYIISSIIYLFLNISSIRKSTRVSFNLVNMFIYPIAASLIAGIITFLIGLLLNLFLPATIIQISCLIVFVFITFIAYAKTNIVTAYKLESTFLGSFFISLGKGLNIF